MKMLSIKLRLFFILISLNKIQCHKEYDSWWNNKIFYQLNIKHYIDSNNDGIGDINGVIETLFHFSTMNIDAVLLSTIFRFENDCNYHGIKDFYHVNSEFGDEYKMIAMFEAFKSIGIKVILDINLDTISTKSKWFFSSSNREQGFEDFFIWETNPDRPHDNSTSIDPKYAWKWDENRKEHYLAIENPPVGYPVLNYKSERVREEIKSVLTWWTKWDISGFRVFLTTDEDVVETMTYLKDAMDRCYGNSYNCKPQILIGEFRDYASVIYKTDYERIRNSFHLVFDENLININEKSSARDIKFRVDETMTYLQGVQATNWMMGSLRRDRFVDRIGRRNSMNMLFLIYTLPGNVVIQQGDEIGMVNAKVDNENAFASMECSEILRNFRLEDFMDMIAPDQFPYKFHVFFLSFRKTLENEKFEWLVVSDNLLVSRRSYDDDYLITALNFGSNSETVDLNDSVQKLIVYLPSPNSKYNESEEIKPRFQLQGSEGLIMFGIKKHTSCISSKPIDKIVKKLTDAVKKIKTFLNS